ncbi:MAG: isoprenylcysteine carboxylmethyltransferase family protein [Rhodobacteraceae bacterium]|nr:isoprenylcysteine carboxylmethyltransferase family protein [Paracoccaceae bacterium]
MRKLDYPPVWLAGTILLVWLETRLVGPLLPFAPVQGAGTALLLLGLALLGGAALSFWRARSTIIPHQTPGVLITSGLFRLSRNPIYLGDALILAGMSLRWGAVTGLVLLPAFLWVLTKRFIEPEEQRLRAAFGPEADAYFARTRRWL